MADELNGAACRIFKDPEELSLQAARTVTEEIEKSLDHGPDPVAIALAGGKTPRKCYEHLAAVFADSVRWERALARVHIFWGDERIVPLTDPDSNYRMAAESLLNKVRIPRENIHPLPFANLPPEKIAATYETELKNFFRGARPVFDLMLLGMGADGHTASLFPGTPALAERARWVREVHVPHVSPAWRITLTLPVLNEARRVLFLVSGADKAETLAKISRGGHPPASQVRGSTADSVTWMLDRAAAAGLPR